MFSGIREHSTIYVMDKTGDSPRLLVGEVEKVSNQYNKLGTYQPTHPYVPASDVFVDLEVRLGEETMKLKELPAQAFISEKSGYVVSESREAMLAEMETMRRKSRDVINSVPWNENVLAACDEMEPILNPDAAREREQSERIKHLEEKVGGMEGTLHDIHGMLSSVLEKTSVSAKK